MATVFALTPQPIRLTSTGRAALYLAVDVSSFDALDMEIVCAVEGTASNAAISLFTGMQTDTDDGWVVPTSNFTPISGTGQQVSRVSLSSGLLQYLRWDVSSLGGASSLTFFIRGVGRIGGTGVGSVLSGMQQISGTTPIALTTSVTGTGNGFNLSAPNLTGAAGGNAILNIDGGNITNLLGIAISNAGPGTTGFIYTANLFGNWFLQTTGGLGYLIETTNQAQRFSVNNEAYAGSADFAYMFQAATLTATKAFMRWKTFASQTGPLLDIQSSSGTSIFQILADSSVSPTGVYAESVGSSLASAGTISPTKSVHHVTGTTTISTINLPYTGFKGSLKLIPDAIWATNTAGNIGLASTAVVGRVMEMTYDGTKWYPSY